MKIMQAVRTSKADVILLENNQVEIRIREHAQVEREDLVQIHEAKISLVYNRPHTVLFFAPQFGSISREARLFAASREMNHNAVAKAIVSKHSANRLVSRIFINLYKPSAPTRLFSCENEARMWLDEKRKKGRSSSHNR